VVTERPDRLGFGLPEAPLLSALAGHMRARIEEGSLLRTPWVDPLGVRALLDRHAGGDTAAGRAVWRLHALATWAREFDVALD